MTTEELSAVGFAAGSDGTGSVELIASVVTALSALAIWLAGVVLEGWARTGAGSGVEPAGAAVARVGTITRGSERTALYVFRVSAV